MRIAADPGSMRSVDQRKVRIELSTIEYHLRTVRRDVEVANIEVRRKLPQYALLTGSNIEKPEVLVADFTAEDHEPL
jgi:hypothetical protein